jgi:hypothetical protein
MPSVAVLKSRLTEVETEIHRVSLEAASLSGDGRAATNHRLTELEAYANSLRTQIARAARGSRSRISYVVPRT